MRSSSPPPRRAAFLAALAVVAVVAVPAGAAHSPNDPLYATNQWAPQKVGAPAAWHTTTGTGVRIGIVDTGIDLGHDDLAARIVASAACIGTSGNSGNCVAGAAAQDVDGHGTHVAGIAAATKDNAIGIAGMAPGADLVVARVFRRDPLTGESTASFEDVNAGIAWVVSQGAKVVNLSLGGHALTTGLFGSSPSLETGIAHAWASGAVPVLAAGNTNLFGLGSSNYGTTDALVVGATGRNDEVASYSSPTGDARWALLAPGGDSASGGETSEIYSTVPGDGYGYEQGTSMAAPHVSGAAALLLSLGLANHQVRDTLLATVQPMSCGSGSTNCRGRLDVARAIATTAATTTSTSSTTSSTTSTTALTTTTIGIATSTTSTTTTTTTARPGSHPVTRLAGADRIETAIAASAATTAAGGARAAVLSRHDQFADALAGTPLAVAAGGPLLLTPSESLDPRVEAELRRVLASGAPVHLLGGAAALAPAVERRLLDIGFRPVRHAGEDRYDTAVKVAQALSNPGTVLLATGLDFPDALAGGAAAARAGAAVLLTAGDALAPATAAYLQTHPSRRYALGGPASRANREATPIAGDDRYDTSRRVAETFFAGGPPTAGIASGVGFADALGGGSHIGRLGGPLLLSSPDLLPDAVRFYLVANRSAIGSASLYGGVAALSERVRTDVEAAIR